MNNRTLKKTPGRKPYTPTDNTRREVELMAGLGLPQKKMAALLGIAHSTLAEHYRTELDRGDARATMRVAQTLFEQAINGNTAAAIFWMKARAGWSERIKLEHGAAEDMKPVEAVEIRVIK